MSRLRNRMVKADFWTDPELLRWPRDKRHTYQGLWAIAEDSGCLEDDPFGWKLQLWPSPLDSDITVELLTQWRNELVECGKLIPYEADGKRYLYVRNFHQHEKPRNPQRPDLPLPGCVTWVTVTDEKGRTRSSYTVAGATATVTPQNSDSTESLLSPPSSLVPSRLVPSCKEEAAAARAREGDAPGSSSVLDSKEEDQALHDCWAIPGWVRDEEADRATLAFVRRTYPLAHLPTIVQQINAKARAGTLKTTPMEALIAFAKQEQARAPRPRPDPPTRTPLPELTEEQRLANLEEMRRAKDAVARLAGARPVPA